MRYVWSFLLLCSFVAFAQSRPIRPAPASASTISQPGRYQIFFNPNIRADTFLVDTETGKIWRMQTFTDVVGEPTVWLPETRLDSQAEIDRFLSALKPEPTATPSATKQP